MINNKIERAKLILGSVSTGYTYPDRGEKPLPIPEWMQEYITYETLPSEGRGAKAGPLSKRVREERVIPTLRPLSAQERLDPEQLRAMAGLQAFGKSMIHKRGLEGAADISRWWSPYTTQSQSMFSKGTTPARWATATQR